MVTGQGLGGSVRCRSYMNPPSLLTPIVPGKMLRMTSNLS
jgi:hypothetical protein